MLNQFAVNEKEKKLYLASIELTVGLWLLYLSNLYRTPYGNTRLQLFIFPQNMIIMIFGIFQAINFWFLSQKITKTEGTVISIISLIGNSFVYMSFYTIVLLPLSGLGFIEHIIVSLVIFSDFFSKITVKKLPTIGQNPMSILTFGALLFIAKIVIFYIFPDDIYTNFFVGNNTARTILAIIGGGAILLMLSQLKTNFFSTKNKENKLRKIIKNSIKSIIAFISLPAIIVIALCFGIVALFLVEGILNDILQFIEPILSKVLKTGENKIPVTKYYIVMQMISFFSLMIYQASFYIHLSKGAKLLAQENYKEIKDQYKDISESVLLKLQKDCLKKPLLIATNKDLYNYSFLETYQPQIKKHPQT